ncbi:NAD(P)/FAD-dependent oxidoreductase [Paraburkholderia aspalathi]|uniref:NAD(P)/FAD-dependent oxidoreductase n=1 Tax=Paraburkholderia aspalathi TaxID=1324617 RepID=UPI0019091BC1|nr:FAD-binding oxidoreductase [Paraburkholderia aspalathi]MBK3824398.1 FAD-binding oxidoreductase [Paraburkholderia aspalathi]
MAATGAFFDVHGIRRIRLAFLQPPHHWRKISKEDTLDYPQLAYAAECDFAIIGGGLSGLSAAIELARMGASVSLLEQDSIGQAASGRNNGQVIPHHSKKSPGEIEALLGRERGAQYNTMVATAPSNLFDLIDRYGIACDSVRNGWIQACHSTATLKRGRIFYDEWRSFGAPVEWLDRDELSARLGSAAYPGGWKAHRGGHLNPYALCRGMARAAASEGAIVYEQSPVTRIVRDGDRWRLESSRGSLRAKFVLVVTNALTENIWPRLNRSLIPVRIYQVATERLSADQRLSVLPGNEGMSDTRRDIFACRYDVEDRLEAVGAHTLWHDAARRGQEAVLAKFHAAFPQLRGLAAAEYWEGTLAVVPDRIPRLMELAPGLLFAGVYSGRGVAMSTVWGAAAARLLAGVASERDMPVPVTPMRTVFGHDFAVQVARFVHPWHRFQDQIEAKASTRK